ncbi:MAG: NADPH-dependent FMN reductase, partial [Flavipsychrobacter sp.]
IISCTNRQDSMTLKVAQLYYDILSAKTENVRLLSLLGKNVYERNNELKQIEAEYLIPAEKIVFVMPEYNGSFPGVLKLMMDNSDIKKCWWHKKAMLVGVADGRGGNLRGIEHMTNILHYLKMHVLYNKMPLSRINDEISPSGEWLKQGTLKAINEQIDEFIKF